MIWRSVGSFALMIATTAGITAAASDSTNTTKSSTLQCWKSAPRASHFRCAQAMKKACSAPVTWDSPGTSAFVLESYKDCEARLILPYNQLCDLSVFQRIMDTCIPRVIWIWEEGGGGSWNVEHDPSGSIPDVIVPSNKNEVAYALYALNLWEPHSRIRPHENVVGRYHE